MSYSFDYTTSTAVDPNSRVTETSATKLDYAAIQRDESAYNTWDLGANHYAGDFRFYVDVTATAGHASTSVSEAIMLANILNDAEYIRANDHAICVQVNATTTNVVIILREFIVGSVTAHASGSLSLSTTYYLDFYRDESVGTYGTAYCDIYTSSANRTAQTSAVANLVVTLNEKADFRYLYGFSSSNNSTTPTQTGYFENLVSFETIIEPPAATFNFTGKVPVVNTSPVTAIPKANFNFTGKVLTVVTTAPTILPVPVATFNFTRKVITVRTTDVAVAPPLATFNFTGKVLTVDVTDSVALAIPKASFNFTGKVPAIVLTNSEDEITWGLFDSTGAAITAAAPTIKIRQRATGYLLDWSDNTYKAAGGVTPSSTMTELNAADFPGYYSAIITVTGWSDGYYVAATTYTAATSQNGSVEFLVQGGQLADSYNSSRLDAAVSSRLASTSYYDDESLIKLITALLLSK